MQLHDLDLDHLPPVLETAQAAEILGVTADLLWKLARAGTAPITPLRLGRVYRWPTAPLLRSIGLDRSPGASEAPGEGASSFAVDVTDRAKIDVQRPA